MARSAVIERITKETQIKVWIDLDGASPAGVYTFTTAKGDIGIAGGPADGDTATELAHPKSILYSGADYANVWIDNGDRVYHAADDVLVRGVLVEGETFTGRIPTIAYTGSDAWIDNGDLAGTVTAPYVDETGDLFVYDGVNGDSFALSLENGSPKGSIYNDSGTVVTVGGAAGVVNERTSPSVVPMALEAIAQK